MPIDLNDPQHEPTLGLFTGRGPLDEREPTQREKLEDGLRSNAVQEGGVRKIKMNGKRFPRKR